MFALIDYNLVCIPFICFLPSLDRVNKSMFLSASLNEETRDLDFTIVSSGSTNVSINSAIFQIFPQLVSYDDEIMKSYLNVTAP